ncbi:MAG: YhjD/YihY/BrkB family envelope integrity protein [Ignavibacteriaceae bacterium]|nr:YhjD/YihY/BrkB family envelope integrity protein [Ignavibacteriaceae bacterium]
MKKKLIEIWKFIERVFDQWIEDKCPKLGAALSFYTIFSLSPLLVIVVSIAGFIFGEAAARGEIVHQIQDLVGKEGAMIVQTALKRTIRIRWFNSTCYKCCYSFNWFYSCICRAAGLIKHDLESKTQTGKKHFKSY